MDISAAGSQYYMQSVLLRVCHFVRHFVTLLCYRLGDIFESVHKASCCREKCTGANVDTQVVQPFVALNDV
jgi:hypothetical protein